MSNVILIDGVPVGYMPNDEESVSVTADGVKTYRELLTELCASINPDKITYKSCLTVGGVSDIYTLIGANNSIPVYLFSRLYISSNNIIVDHIKIRTTSGNADYITQAVSTAPASSQTDHSTDKPADGTVITLHY